MQKEKSKKEIILEIVLKWLNKEAKIKDWMEFKWGRKRFKIRRIH